MKCDDDDNDDPVVMMMMMMIVVVVEMMICDYDNGADGNDEHSRHYSFRCCISFSAQNFSDHPTGAHSGLETPKRKKALVSHFLVAIGLISELPVVRPTQV